MTAAHTDQSQERIPDAAAKPGQLAPDRRFISSLTSLRFFAAMAVVLFHSGSTWAEEHRAAPLPIITLLKNGYLGVAFFFLLSGFILQHVYRGALSSRGQLRDFAVARVARLYPVYILALLLTAPFEFHASRAAIPQLFLLQCWTPMGASPFENWNMPAWTLSVELFLYLLFPLLSRWAARARPASLWRSGMAIGLFELLTGSSSLISDSAVASPWLAWLPLPLLRLPEFVLGILTAEAIVRRGSGPAPPTTVVVVLLAIVLSVSSSPMIAGIATLLSAILIYSAALDRSSALARLLAHPALIYLGGASYAIYLMQQPVHMALDWAGCPPLLYYPALVGFAALVFRYYEEPARQGIRILARASRASTARQDRSLLPDR